MDYRDDLNRQQFLALAEIAEQIALLDVSWDDKYQYLLGPEFQSKLRGTGITVTYSDGYAYPEYAVRAFVKALTQRAQELRHQELYTLKSS
jgi:hypothetical protein